MYFFFFKRSFIKKQEVVYTYYLVEILGRISRKAQHM